MISANPTTFVEGGLIDDIDGKILEAGTQLFDYGGKSNEVPALRLVIGYGENYGDIHIQYYSAGDTKNFVPTQGDEAFESAYGTPEGTTVTIGRGFDAVGDKGFLGKNSNTGMLLASLVNSGFPAEKLESGDYTSLVGAVCHFLRQPVPERKGLANPEGGKDKRPQTILLVSEVKALPGAATGKAGTKTATASKPAAAKATTTATAAKPAPATGAPAADTSDTAEMDEKLAEFLVGQIAEKGGTIKKKELVPLVFGHFAKTEPAVRNYGVKRVVTPDFLAAGGPWTFEADVLSL